MPNQSLLVPPLGVLFATSEALPLVKTGGLADVSGSLPASLRALGHDARLVLPAYPQAVARAGGLTLAASLRLPGVREPVEILAGQLPNQGPPVYLIAAHEHFERGGNPYLDLSGKDWGDNPDRFALFCRVIALMAQDQAGLGWAPDLVHCNDWQTGLVPVLLADEPSAPPCLFTIHNLSYQGVFDRAAFNRIKLPERYWRTDALEYHGGFSFIKGGIVFSQRVNTVSPTYAEQIRHPALGYGLDGLFRHLGTRFSGILNGIDYQEWDPARDPHLVQPYDADDFAPKLANKLALQAQFNLPQDPDVLLFGYIGRLVEQKGVDLILAILPRLMAHPGVQILLQGTGEPLLEHALEEAQRRYPGQVAVYLGYDEGKAHLIEAGCDAFIMPSRFEPCGLNQLYSLRYGTVPIVHRTGGLADTVVDATPSHLQAGTATGFVFEHADAAGLWYAIREAMLVHGRSRDEWRKLAINGMRQDFSWGASSSRYAALYQAMLAERHPRA